MKILTKEDVEWTVNCEPEDMAIEDSFEDREVVAEIQRQLDAGNEWGWCYVNVTGRFAGLEASDGLGGCSYSSEKEFRQSGGYFDDMQNNVIADLQEKLFQRANAPLSLGE